MVKQYNSDAKCIFLYMTGNTFVIALIFITWYALDKGQGKITIVLLFSFVKRFFLNA